MKKIIVMGWALLVCQMATGVGTPKLDLVSKEGEKIRLSRAAALKPGVSGLIATSLEADKDAPEVPLRSVSSAILNRFVPIWEFIDTRIGNGLFGELSAAEQKNLITAIQKKLGLIKRSEIGELINAANYLDSQPLLQALLWQYSGFLGLNKAGIMQRLASDNIPKGLRTDVARAYFLMHGEDMATEFAKMTIPVDVLAAYGYIPAEIFKHFPNLATNPNEVYTWRYDNQEFKETPLTYLIGVNEFQDTDMKNLRALLKIKGIDINLYSPLAIAFSHAQLDRDEAISAANELLHAGAGLNSLTIDGITPLIAEVWYLKDEAMMERLIKGGASIEKSLEVLKKLPTSILGEHSANARVESELLKYRSQKTK